jgi:hypothetical protein
MTDSLIETWRQIILGDEKSWVLFENGTCVILMAPEADLRQQATELLKEWGVVQSGTPAGDFSVIALSEHPGWVVTGSHPDILNYVSPEEVEPDAAEFMIGLLGRAMRDQDAEELNIIHVEDKRIGENQ